MRWDAAIEERGVGVIDDLRENEGLVLHAGRERAIGCLVAKLKLGRLGDLVNIFYQQRKLKANGQDSSTVCMFAFHMNLMVSPTDAFVAKGTYRSTPWDGATMTGGKKMRYGYVHAVQIETDRCVLHQNRKNQWNPTSRSYSSSCCSAYRIPSDCRTPQCTLSAEEISK